MGPDSRNFIILNSTSDGSHANSSCTNAKAEPHSLPESPERVSCEGQSQREGLRMNILAS